MAQSTIWDVYVMEFARSKDQPWVDLISGMYREGVTDLPFSFILAQQGGRNVLVDTGFMQNEHSSGFSRKFGIPTWISPIRMLAEMGIRPEAISDIFGRGRDGDYSPPPAQIPACGFPAPGSCRRSDVTGVGAFSAGPYSIRARAAPLRHAGSGTVPGACRPTLASFGRAPSLHALRRRSSQPCSGASSVLRARPTPHPFPDGLPTRVPATARDRQRDCGPDEVSQVPTASFRA